MKEESKSINDTYPAPDGSSLHIQYMSGEWVEVATMKSGEWVFHSDTDEALFRLSAAFLKIDQQER